MASTTGPTVRIGPYRWPHTSTRSGRLVCRAAATAWSPAASTRRAGPRKRLPASVSSTWCLPRTNNSTPSSSSSRAIRLDSACWLRNSPAAARPKCSSPRWPRTRAPGRGRDPPSHLGRQPPVVMSDRQLLDLSRATGIGWCPDQPPGKDSGGDAMRALDRNRPATDPAVQLTQPPSPFRGRVRRCSRWRRSRSTGARSSSLRTPRPGRGPARTWPGPWSRRLPAVRRPGSAWPGTPKKAGGPSTPPSRSARWPPSRTA